MAMKGVLFRMVYGFPQIPVLIFKCAPHDGEARATSGNELRWAQEPHDSLYGVLAHRKPKLLKRLVG